MPSVEAIWVSLVAQLGKNLPEYRRSWLNSWVRKICWRRDRLPTPGFLGLIHQDSLVAQLVKNLPAMQETLV